MHAKSAAEPLDTASQPLPGRYTIRTRTLRDGLRPDAPTVWDVTETHHRCPVAYGVHTSPDRAAAHLRRLTRG